jgi:2'-5' RNA ligase
MADSGTIRCFWAIACPAVFGAACDRLADRWPQAALRWIPAANRHLSLRFLGEIPAELALRSAEAVGLQWKPPPAPSFEVERLLWLPHPDRPRVLAAVLRERAGYLRLIFGELQAILAGEGIAPETRPFLPHLTLARMSGTATEAERGALVREAGGGFPAFLPERLVLYRSDLAPSGARYTPLREIPLPH